MELQACIGMNLMFVSVGGFIKSLLASIHQLLSHLIDIHGSLVLAEIFPSISTRG